MKFGGFFIALALVLAACSGDPQPREPDPTTAAPSATSTATPPAMPAQASEDSPEGAAAFVTYWVQVSNYAAATGDVTELSRISAPDCSGCQKYIDLYRDTYEAGGYFKGGDWKLGTLSIEVSDSESFATTTVAVGAGTYRATSEDSEESGAPTKDEVTFAVANGPEERRVNELVLGDGR